jgi:hypothetical protein
MSGSAWTQIATGVSPPYTDTTGDVGEVYDYRVVAIGSGTASAGSNVAFGGTEAATVSGTASVTGIATLTVSGIKGGVGTSAPSSVGEVSASGTKAGLGSAAPSAIGDLTVVGTKSAAGSAEVTGIATLSVVGESSATPDSVVKVRVGSSFLRRLPKVRGASSFVESLPRIRLVSGWQPPFGTAPLYAEDFTGTDGAAWPSPWTNLAGTAGWIDGNRGRHAPVDGPWGVSQMGIVPASLTLTDFEWVGDYEQAAPTGTGDRYSVTHLMFRGSGTSSGWGQQTTGYGILVYKTPSTTIVAIARYNSSETQIASGNISNFARLSYKIRAVGSALKVKLWEYGASEPGSWTLEATDATYASGGIGIVTARGTTNEDQNDAWHDNIVILPFGTAPLYAEDFTGTDGAAWPSPWVTGTGNAGTIQSNRGELTGRSTAWDPSHLRIPPADLTIDDCEWTGDWEPGVPGSGTREAGIITRGSGSEANNGWQHTAAYGIYLANTPTTLTLKIERNTNPGSTLLATTTMTSVARYSFRLRTVGSAIKLRVWEYGTSEPGTWTLETTDASYASGGIAVLYALSYTGGVRNVLWDNFEIVEAS